MCTHFKMAYHLLLSFMVFVSCMVGIKVQYTNRIYSSKPECGLGAGKALLGKVVEIFIVGSKLECALKCNMNSNCHSFNYNAKTGSCQLNSGVAGSQCNLLSSVTDYKYYENTDYVHVSHLLIKHTTKHITYIL